MLNPNGETSLVSAADNHLRAAVYLVSAQENRLARCRAAGLDTLRAEQLLIAMHAALRNLISHRQVIRDALAQLERRPWH